MTEEVRKAYLNLAKKYSLPKLEEIDREFDLEKLETHDFLLRDIRKKMLEKFDFFYELLEEVLHPGTNLSNLYESGFFPDEEKAAVFNVYKKVMAIRREAYELAIRNDERYDADFIKKVFKGMPSLKEKLLPIIAYLRQSWEREAETQEKLGYFG